MFKAKFLLCGFASLVLASQAWAAPVVPGMTINAVAEPDPVGGATIAGPLVTPLASAGSFSATLTSSVISGDVSNPLGGLTFTYQLSNDAASVDPIGRLTVENFLGWLTDMSYQPGVGLTPPTTMDRSANGNVVGYSFLGPPVGVTPLMPGMTSELLVVQTDAPNFVISTGNVIDGGIASGPAYAPVPEPASLLLLCASAGLWLKRRR